MSQRPIDVIEITDSPPKKKNKKASVICCHNAGGRGLCYEVMDRQYRDQIVWKRQLNAFSTGNHMVFNLDQISTRRFFKY